ncbi:MAG: thiol-disulfide oxidoreductase DCC family protein [Flavobacteriaceae bacterium]|nr:thiol-disulfide oxidoreductase DCC family protein [Flavobacteriaceae bacterium]
MIEKLLQDKQLILFDGVCNFCNATVVKIIKHDTKNKFVFASLQSNIGQTVVNHFSIDSQKVDSIILVTSEQKYFIKSTAALKIGKHFSGFWVLLQICWIVPAPVRNVVYDFIAKNRYKWFGKKDNCMIPTPEISAKFIDI